MRATYLPPDFEPLEHAYVGSGPRHAQLDFPISTTPFAATVPAKFLPWLAWQYSVDVWKDSWPEDRKRQAVATAVEIHERKGTVHSVRLALSLLGCRVKITEWWQTEPPGQRGTFHVRAYANERDTEDGVILSAQLVKQTRSAVMASKPKSRAFTLDIGVAIAGTLSVGVAAQTLQIGQFASSARTPRVGRSQLSVAVGSQALQLGLFNGEAATPRHGRSTIAIAAAAQAIQVGQFQSVASHRSMR